MLYYYIQKDGWGAAAYFTSIITFGNIILLNIFLALLLNFIQDQSELEELEKKKQEAEENNKNEMESRLRMIENGSSMFGSTQLTGGMTERKLISKSFSNIEESKSDPYKN